MLPPKFIPTSPTVTSFQRFDAQQLVNLPTGAAQLSVPLAEVNSGALHLPVSLAYSYSGLQVYQPRDLVGLGWALQAGASISVQVNGIFDAAPAGPGNEYSPANVSAGLNDPRYLKRVADGAADSGPDLYSFSLPEGPSGRFVVRDTTVILLPQQPVHIRLLASGGFQITTESGVRYQFQAVEQTRPNPNNFSSTFGSFGTYASAWQLTRMISTDNADTLRFYYTSYGFEQVPNRCSVTTGHYYVNVSGMICGPESDYPFYNAQMFPNRLRSQYLDSVTGQGVHLVLTRAATSHEVQRVQLMATTGGRREIKTTVLYQSAFDGGSPTDYRLRLDSLQESANGVSLPTYRFAYLPGYMPARGSAAQDYWGFSNSATRNGDYTTTTVPTLLADPRLGSLAANRKPDFASSIAGALQEVRYPTGGTSRWEYEPNRLASDFTDIPLSYSGEYVGTSYDDANAQPVPGGTRRVTSSSLLIFQVAQEGDVEVLLHREPHDSVNTTGGTNAYRDFNIWHRLPTGDTLITNATGPGFYKILDGLPTLKNFVFHLQPGTYTAQVYCELYEANSDISFRIPYRDSAAVRLGLMGPGIRVSQTTTTAPQAPPLVRRYSYTVGAAQGGTSSGLSLLPQYGMGFDSHSYTEYGIGTSIDPGTGQPNYASICYFMNTSSDNTGLGNEFNKYNFYYTQVTERLGSSQGLTVSYFTHRQLQFNDVVLAERYVYRQDPMHSERLQLATSESYTYATDSIISFPTFRPRLESRILPGIVMPTTQLPEQYVPDTYEIQAAFEAPVLAEQSRYDEHGAAHTTSARSTYQRQRLVRTATRTNTGWDIQRFKRLSDYAATPAVTALRVNAFNPVIESQSWHRSLLGPDSVLVGGSLTLYDPAWRSPARTYRLRLAQPVTGPNQETVTNGRFDAWFSDSRYEPTATVRYAATSGDLIEQRPAHGLPTSYLTGYARTLVIAQASNATYAQLAYTSFEPDATGRWRYDSTGTHREAGGRTGRWAYRLDGPNDVCRTGLPVGDYDLLFWAQGSTVPTLSLTQGTSSAPQQVATASGDWYQYRARLHLTAVGSVALGVSPGGTTLLDEVRLAPVGAQLTSYTHDPLVGVTSQTDPSGRTTTYEYDGLGRLLRTRDEQGRVLSQQQYHYAGH